MRDQYTAAVAWFVFLAVQPARAEFQIGANFGWNKSFSSDVSLTGPDGTDFTVESVSWDGVSLPGVGGAPYYGVRAAYWFDDGASWGVMADYTHAKVRAEMSQTVTLVGNTGSANVAPGDHTVASLFNRLELTNGVGLFTLNGLYRFAPIGRLQPYAGVGAGFSLPHVQVNGAALSNLPSTFEFQSGGPTAQGFAGVDVRLSNLLSVYGEYRINYAPIDAELADSAYEIETELINNHILFGVSVHF